MLDVCRRFASRATCILRVARGRQAWTEPHRELNEQLIVSFQIGQLTTVDPKDQQRAWMWKRTEPGLEQQQRRNEDGRQKAESDVEPSEDVERIGRYVNPDATIRREREESEWRS